MNALSRKGAWASAFVGAGAVAAGWTWAALLITYFVTSTALTRWRRDVKAARSAGIVDKGGPRDPAQVAANGGGFFVAALISVVAPVQTHALWLALGAGTLAASAADTWATEIGIAVGGLPRSILTGHVVPAGTSGGVSIAGGLAALAGAALVGGTATALGWSLSVAASAFVGGLVGTLIDSVLGATVQSRSWCASCESPTEQALHRCGSITTRVGGVSWINNDVVNLMACGAGGLVAMALVWRGVL